MDGQGYRSKPCMASKRKITGYYLWKKGADIQMKEITYEKMTVGQALVRFLDQQYVSLDGEAEKFVDGVFTIFGHGIVCGFGQALYEYTRINSKEADRMKVYQGRNEQGMAHAAAGFAKQNNRRKIIACASSIGPGAANMVTAAADATANNIPLLLFTGDTFATRQPDPVLQQIEQFHDATLTTSDAFRPVSRYWDRVSRPEQLMSAMLNAMQVLTDPVLTGSVCISLPQDVQGESYDFPSYFFEKRIHRITRTIPEADEIEKAAEILAHKSRPLIIAGGGVRYSEAGSSIEEFCDTFGIPFAETQAGKSAVSSDNPWNLGGIGVTGNHAANKLAKEADCIIGIGTKLSDFTTASKSLFQNPDVEFILINASKYHAKKLDATAVIADAKLGTKALFAALLEKKDTLGTITGNLPADENSKRMYSLKNDVQQAKAEWARIMQQITSTDYTEEGYHSLIKAKEAGVEEEFVIATGGILTQTAAIKTIRDTIEENAIVVGASGSLPGDLQRMWTTKKKDSYHMEYGYSCMGYEIAAAFGAKLAFPDQPCYAFVGDGAFMMLHSEIASTIQEKKKIIILLFDNCGFGCINNLQMGNGIGSLATMFRYRSEESGQQDGALIATDFAMIGRGYGMAGYTAKNREELQKALLAAKLEERSVLIDIKVLPKSMTDGYGAWWHVGIGDSLDPDIKEAHQRKEENLLKARRY